MSERKNDRFSALKNSESQPNLFQSHVPRDDSMRKNNTNEENIFKKDNSNKRFESLITNSNPKQSGENQVKKKIKDNNESISRSSTSQKSENAFLSISREYETNVDKNNEEEYPSLPWANEEIYLTRLELEDKMNQQTMSQDNQVWKRLFTTHCVPYNEDCDLCYQSSYESRRNIEEKKENYRYMINKFKREMEIQKQKEINDRFNEYWQRHRERLINSFEYDYVWSEEEKREYVDGYCYYCEKHSGKNYNDDDSGNDPDETDDIIIDNKKYKEEK